MSIIRDEGMVKCIKEVLHIVSNHYPDEFTDDGITLKGTQLVGVLQQLLSQPIMMPQGIHEQRQPGQS
jgi:hypothetical protein